MLPSPGRLDGVTRTDLKLVAREETPPIMRTLAEWRHRFLQVWPEVQASVSTRVSANGILSGLLRGRLHNTVNRRVAFHADARLTLLTPQRAARFTYVLRGSRFRRHQKKRKMARE